jgi:methylmalonyl-CoA/ethylmalonyl-CoA epimerase
MTKIKVDHIAVVVADMDAALGFWQDALGLSLSGTERNDQEAVDVAFLPAGSSRIELLQPTDDASGIARYLAKHGPGMHHLCLAVPHIDAVLEQLRSHQIELINDQPRTRTDGTRYAFVHPRSTGGVLVELYQTPEDTA